MGKSNSREESDVKREIRKIIPQTHGLDDYRGSDISEVEDRIEGIPCRFCGQMMTPHRDWGGACMWRCWSISCPNNIDSPLKFEVRDLEKYLIHNTERSWGEWKPKRIC